MHYPQNTVPGTGTLTFFQQGFTLNDYDNKCSITCLTFDLLLLLWVDVEHLDDVGDKVGEGLVLLDLLLVLLDGLLLGLQLVLDPPQLAPHNPNLITYKQQPVIKTIRIRKYDLKIDPNPDPASQ